jgi:GPH family glycoside/pentoside/hexuronide:cation symporter
MLAEKLSLKTKLGFGIGDLGGNLFFTALSFWALHYLTDVVGLAAASAGAALMLGKLWDALVDPVVGMMSDRTRTRWGRRRPYLLFGAIPLGLVMALFFAAPGLTGQAPLFWWALLVFALLNTAYSFVNIPYGSLTPELTADYHERTALNGFRFGFAVVGTLLGAVLVQPILGLIPGNPKAGFSLVGLIFGAVVTLTALATGFSVREKPVVDAAENISFWKSWMGVLKNKPFRIILFAYSFHLIGITFLSGMLVYYFKYILGNEGETTLAMALLLVVAMVFIPVSVMFSKRFGKVRTYQVSMMILAVAALLIWLFGASMGTGYVLAVMTGAGVGMGFGYVPPFAIVPDTIEVEARKTGRREEGAYYGLWNFAVKMSQAAGTAGSGLVLGFAGYAADKVQTPLSLAAIQLLIGPVPAFFFLASAALLLTYPLDEKAYKAAVG